MYGAAFIWLGWRTGGALRDWCGFRLSWDAGRSVVLGGVFEVWTNNAIAVLSEWGSSSSINQMSRERAGCFLVLCECMVPHSFGWDGDLVEL